MTEIREVTTSGRRLAESLMIDTCRITRSGPLGEWDEVAGERSPSIPAVIYTGKCRVRPLGDATPETPVAGAHKHLQNSYRVSVPVSATGIQERDTIEITDAVLDPELVVFRGMVTSVPRFTAATARRLIVEEVTG